MTKTQKTQQTKIQTHKWADIKAGMTPESRARVAARVRDALEREALHLAELRKVRRLTQQQLAETMGNSQSDISKIERSADMMLSTMQRFVEAAGGHLRLVVEWPDGDEQEVTLTDADAR